MRAIQGNRILVTGGAGFIGSHLVDALVDGNEVVVLDNLSSGKRENLQHHLDRGAVRLIEGDVRDLGDVQAAMQGCAVIFHLAVQCLRVSLFDPRLVHEVNATGTLNLCEAALKNKISRFVYVSSSEVYGSAVSVPMDEEHPLLPTTPYGASKLAGEMYAMTFHRTYGLPVVVVRPFNTYGPRAHFEGAYGEVIPKFVVRALSDKSPVVFGDGLQTRDFTFVGDTVEGLLRAARATEVVGQAINIANGHEVSINEIASQVLDLTGRTDLQPLYTPARPADVRRHLASVSKAERLLGFRAKIAVRDGLRNYIDWFRSSVKTAEAIDYESQRNWRELISEGV